MLHFTSGSAGDFKAKIFVGLRRCSSYTLLGVMTMYDIGPRSFQLIL
jgi:hypothetical protein